MNLKPLKKLCLKLVGIFRKQDERAGKVGREPGPKPEVESKAMMAR